MLGLVAEQTGYPEDLLDMDLDLEADLGIDTVKQAEVFAAIREAYGIERDDTLKLRDYPTINHVVGFVRERAGGGADAPTSPTPPKRRPDPPAVPERAELPGETATADAQSEHEGYPRRVPEPVLRPPLGVCVETGVKLGEGNRVVVMPDRGGVAKALAKRLATSGVEVLAIKGAPEVEQLEQQIEEWKAAGPIQGVYWLPALDEEGDIGSLEPADWRQALHIRVKLLATTMRALADQVEEPGTFLVARHPARRAPRLRSGGSHIRARRRGHAASPRRWRASARRCS